MRALPMYWWLLVLRRVSQVPRQLQNVQGSARVTHSEQVQLCVDDRSSDVCNSRRGYILHDTWLVSLFKQIPDLDVSFICRHEDQTRTCGRPFTSRIFFIVGLNSLMISETNATQLTWTESSGIFAIVASSDSFQMEKLQPPTVKRTSLKNGLRLTHVMDDEWVGFSRRGGGAPIFPESPSFTNFIFVQRTSPSCVPINISGLGKPSSPAKSKHILGAD